MADEQKLSIAVVTDPRGDLNFLENALLALPRQVAKSVARDANKAIAEGHQPNPVKFDSLDAIVIMGNLLGPVLSDEEQKRLDGIRSYFESELARFVTNKDYEDEGISTVPEFVGWISGIGNYRTGPRFARAGEQELAKKYREIIGFKNRGKTWGADFGKARDRITAQYENLKKLAEKCKSKTNVPVYVVADTMFFERTMPEELWGHWRELSHGGKLIKTFGSFGLDVHKLIPEYAIGVQRGSDVIRPEEFEPLGGHVLITYELPIDPQEWNLHEQLQNKTGKIVIVGHRTKTGSTRQGMPAEVEKPDEIYHGNLHFTCDAGRVSYLGLNGDDGLWLNHGWDAKGKQFYRAAGMTFNVRDMKAKAETRKHKTVVHTMVRERDAGQKLRSDAQFIEDTLTLIQKENPELAEKIRSGGFDKASTLATYILFIDKQRERSGAENEQLRMNFLPFLEELLKEVNKYDAYMLKKAEIYEKHGVTQGAIETGVADLELWQWGLTQFKAEHKSFRELYKDAFSELTKTQKQRAEYRHCMNELRQAILGPEGELALDKIIEEVKREHNVSGAPHPEHIAIANQRLIPTIEEFVARAKENASRGYEGLDKLANALVDALFIPDFVVDQASREFKAKNSLPEDQPLKGEHALAFYEQVLTPLFQERAKVMREEVSQLSQDLTTAQASNKEFGDRIEELEKTNKDSTDALIRYSLLLLKGMHKFYHDLPKVADDETGIAPSGPNFAEAQFMGRLIGAISGGKLEFVIEQEEGSPAWGEQYEKWIGGLKGKYVTVRHLVERVQGKMPIDAPLDEKVNEKGEILRDKFVNLHQILQNFIIAENEEQYRLAHIAISANVERQKEHKKSATELSRHFAEERKKLEAQKNEALDQWTAENARLNELIGTIRDEKQRIEREYDELETKYNGLEIKSRELDGRLKAAEGSLADALRQAGEQQADYLRSDRDMKLVISSLRQEVEDGKRFLQETENNYVRRIEELRNEHATKYLELNNKVDSANKERDEHKTRYEVRANEKDAEVARKEGDIAVRVAALEKEKQSWAEYRKEQFKVLIAAMTEANNVKKQYQDRLNRAAQAQNLAEENMRIADEKVRYYQDLQKKHGGQQAE